MVIAKSRHWLLSPFFQYIFAYLALKLKLLNWTNFDENTPLCHDQSRDQSTAGKFKDMLQQLDRMILDKQEEMNETKELRDDKS